MNRRTLAICAGLGLLVFGGLAYLVLTLVGRNGGWAAPCREVDLPPERKAHGVPDGGIEQLALGGDRSCAVTKTKKVWCWGASDSTDSPTRLRAWLRPDGALMQVGSDTDPVGNKPIGQAPGPAQTRPDLVQLAQHRFGYCTVDGSGLMQCDSLAIIGAARVAQYRPTASLDKVQRVMVGNEHACALKVDGSLWCWGRNDVGQLGAPKTAEPVALPIQVRDHVVKFALGLAHTCALLEQPPRLECWGDNSAGQLSQSLPPAPPPADITDIAAGASRTCALMRDRSVQCWGRYSITYPVPTGAESPQPATRVVDASANVEQLVAGGDAFCARTAAGRLICWGYLDVAHGFQYPDASLVPTPSSPHTITTPSAVRDVSLGDRHACALLQDGSVMCMGSDEQAQLGAVMPALDLNAGPCGTQRIRAPSSPNLLPVAW